MKLHNVFDAKEFSESPVLIKDKTFPELLALRAAECPSKPLFSFIRDDDTRLTVDYATFYAATLQIADNIAARTHFGDRVLLMYTPGVDYITAFFGCMFANTIPVPCYPPTNKRNSERIDSILRDCTPSLIMTSRGASEKLRRMVEFEQWLETGGESRAGLPLPSPSDEQNRRVGRVGFDGVAFLQYTSGSTASPKGVMVTHRNLTINSEQIRRAMKFTSGSISASWLPPYHDMGLIGGLLQLVYSGATAIVLSPAYFLQQPIRWLRAISFERATHAGAPNFAYDLCVSRITEAQKAELNLSSWGLAFCGAEPIRAETLERFYQAFKSCGFRRESLVPCYGLAEATLMVTAAKLGGGPVLSVQKNVDSSPKDQDNSVKVSSGQPAHHQVVAIVDPESRVRLADGAIGEIWVAGDNIAAGYWGNAAASAETFGATIQGEPDSPQFLRTGDLGFLQNDELYVSGRIKDVIILGGRNIYPQDVEAASCGSHPALRTDGAAAFSIAGDSGEHLVILQELDFRKEISDTLFGHISSAVFDATGAQPDVIVLLKAGGIPRTSSGKIRRQQSRMEFESGRLQVRAKKDKRPLPSGVSTLSKPQEYDTGIGTSQKSAEIIEAWLKARLAEQLKLDSRTIDSDQAFSYYGLDSMRSVELANALSAWIQLPISPTLLWDFPSPRQLAHHLATQGIPSDTVHAASELTVSHVSLRSDEPVAIIGLGCRFPHADNPEDFWQLLSTEIDAVHSVPVNRYAAHSFSDDSAAAAYTRIGGFLEQVDMFDPHFFGIAPLEAKQIDPQQRLILEVAWEALENAAIAPVSLSGSQTGVYIGISSHDYDQLQFASGGGIDLYTATGTALSIVPNRLSYLLDLHGPSLAIDTACSSSLVAVHLACQSLRSGESTLGLAGGVNLMLSNKSSIPFAAAGLLAEDGRCKAFDASANGYVRGEGCGVVVLKRLSDALRDGDMIHAVIAGSAINQDGRSNGLAAPNGKAQAAVIRNALAQANILPAQIDYIEAHGTGTVLGDPIELNALKEVLLHKRASDQRCVIGSVKTNIGHLEAAAGIAGLIKVVLSMEQQKIPANLHYRTLNRNCSLNDTPLTIAHTMQAWNNPHGLRCAGISSFGFGGTLAHVIVAQGPVPAMRKIDSDRPFHLLCLSAKSKTALENMMDRLLQTLTSQRDLALADVAYSLQVGRNTFNYRSELIVGDKTEAVRQLRQARQHVHDAHSVVQPQGIVFMFPGQGAQQVQMAHQLYCHIASFRTQVDACIRLLEPTLQHELRSALFPAEDTSIEEAMQRLNQTACAQPALFIIEYALAQLWIELGIQPQAMIGHSLGEYVAACVAGVFSIETALALVTVRGRLAQTMPCGAMISVALDQNRAARYLSDGIELAAINAPERCVLTGSVPAIDALERSLAEQGVLCKRLRTSHAFHSASMTPILEDYRQAVAAVKLEAPRIPYLSNITGTWITAAQATDPDYWVQHLREPVRFSTGLATLTSEPDLTLIEVGPGRILSGLARQHSACAAMSILPSLNNGTATDTDYQTLLATLGHLWRVGHPVKWTALHKGTGARRIALPTYPFDRQRCWIDQSKIATIAPTDMNTTLSSPSPVTSSSISQRRDKIRTQLSGIVAALLQTTPERVDPRAPLLELGADSLVLVQAIRNIEQAFAVTLTIRQLFEELTSIVEIASYLDRQLPATWDAQDEKTTSNPTQANVMHTPEIRSAYASTLSAPINAPSHASANSITVPPQASPPRMTTQASSSLANLMAKQLEVMQQQLALLGQTQQTDVAPGVENGLIITDSTQTHSHNSGASASIDALSPLRIDPYGKLNPEQRIYFEKFIGTYLQRTAMSKAYATRHRTVLADYRALAGFRFSSKDPILPISLKELFYPIVSARAEGGRMWDLDGNVYVDLTMGFGVNLFGNNAPFIKQALQKQVAQGFQLGPQNALVGEVATQIQQLTGMERVAFCNSGTEAMMLAVRLARTKTARSKIALFTGSYHGWADGTLVAADPERDPYAVAAVPGLQPDSAHHALVLDYGSDHALDMIRAHAHELAAVLVEPVQSRRPELQPQAFLQQLRIITQEHGIALIFDEMITGFRLHPGGAQAWFGVRADMAAYGKAVGGGMPIGIVAGSSAYLNGIDGGPWQNGQPSTASTTFFAGTFSKHPLALAATHAVLQQLIAEGPALQEKLNQRTTQLVQRLNDLFSAWRLPIQVVQCGSLFRLNILHNLDLFCYHLVANGVFVWEGRTMYLSTSHTDADIDHIVHAFAASLHDLSTGGFLPEATPPTPPNSNASGSVGPIIAQNTISTARAWSSSRYSNTSSPAASIPERTSNHSAEPVRLGLSFFGNYESGYCTDKYELLFQAARFADQHEFSALWLPERHFHSFGGLSPNPSILAAALARETTRISLRAGSVVLPLHHPVRVAEEWAMVDNLSNGRAGIAVASGWHPNDFVFAPDAFGNHRNLTFERLEQVRALWQGESVSLRNGAGKNFAATLFPLPKQAELPIWLTIVNNPETYRKAGELGVGILTNLMGQSIDELAQNICIYREALHAYGYAPDKARVTVLLHTFVGSDRETARQLARQPFMDYLGSSLGLFQNMLHSMGQKIEVGTLNDEDRNYLLSAAYDRYIESSALIGDTESCAKVVQRLADIGINEIGCFVDFGIDTESVLASLPSLDLLRQSIHQAHSPARQKNVETIYSSGIFAGNQSPSQSSPNNETSNASSPVVPQATEDRNISNSSVPLSFPQLRLWLIQQYFEGQKISYNMPFALRLTGPLNHDALHAAFQALIARHETLRTNFQILREGDEPLQIITEITQIDMPVIKCLPTEIEQYATQHAEHLFDLAQGSLLKVALLQLSTIEHILLLNMHEIISDGWSMAVLTRDIQQLYGAKLAKLGDTLPTLPIQYKTYAQWQRQLDLTLHRDYWISTLAGYESALPLPYDYPRPANKAWGVGTIHYRFPAELAAHITRFIRKQQATPFMTMLLAALIVLHRHTGRTDMCVGTTVAGRDIPQLEELIGFFINIVPLRLDLSGDPTGIQLLGRIRTAILDGFEHQTMPFDQILSALQLNRDSSQIPLVPVMVRYQNHREASIDSWPGGLGATRVPVSQPGAKSELDLEFFGKESELGVVVEYATDLFKESTIERMIQHLQRVLEEFIENPTLRLSQFSVLTENETKQLLKIWNQSAQAIDMQLSVPMLFERQVRETPDTIACIGQINAGNTQEQLTYCELNDKANHVAHCLRKRGIGPEIRVGLYLERSPEFLIGLLAIFKTGGVYVPIDPSYPKAYVQQILENVEPTLLLTLTPLAEQVEKYGEIACLDVLLDTCNEFPDQAANLPVYLCPENLAYISYTSGSTGKPKGVMVEHRQILNWLHALWEKMPFGPNELVAQKTASASTVSIKEILGGLLCGTPQIFISDAEVKNFSNFASLIYQQKVTRINIVPSHLQAFLESLEGNIEALRSLKYCITAGEPLTQALRQTVMTALPWVQLWNNYGSTELNDTTYCAPEDQDGGFFFVPIGRPIANTEVYILDQYLRPVPIGVTGELHVGSIGMTRGYWQQPGLTAEHFIPNPFSDISGSRLYKTGDYVRYLDNGTLEYLGRQDFDIKIRGNRIDVRQVEQALNQHPEIKQAIVKGWSLDQEAAQLVAYYVPANNTTAANLSDNGSNSDLPNTLTGEKIRDYLIDRLPSYMVPSRFIPLNVFPTLPNGKLSRLNLIAPDSTNMQVGDFIPPSSTLEHALVTIWAELLGRPREKIGICDNFFTIGGHSLLAAQMNSKIANIFHVELPIQTIFRSGDIKTLANQIEQSEQLNGDSSAAPMIPVPRENLLPLSYSQQQMWFLEQLTPGNAHLIIHCIIPFISHLDVRALRLALNALIERHEVLRTIFPTGNGVVHQKIITALQVDIEEVDLIGIHGDELESTIRRHFKETVNQPFDLVKGPLLRAKLMRLKKTENFLWINVHHIIFDGLSLNLMKTEFVALYEGFVQAKPALLPPLPVQYVDYAVWQRNYLEGEELAKRLEFWKKQLEDTPALLDLPTDRPRPATQTYRGGVLHRQMSKPLTQRLIEFCRQQGVTVYVSLLSCFLLLLSKYTHAQRIVIGTPVANRDKPEIQNLIGYFVDLIPFPATIDSNETGISLLQKIEKTAVDISDYKLPFDLLVEKLNPSRSSAYTPIYQVEFVSHNFRLDNKTSADENFFLNEFLSSHDTSLPTGSVYDISISVSETAGQIHTEITYNSDLFDHETIDRLSRHYSQLLDQFITLPSRRLCELSILSVNERHTIFTHWNNTTCDYHGSGVAHECFEGQAACHPDRIAIICGNENLTYGQLNESANQLAHYLRSHNIGPDTRVGICMEPSLDLIIGLLGILKAGAAYVPLDINYPRERLAFMLEDSTPELILTQHKWADILPSGAKIFNLDQEKGKLSAYSKLNPISVAHPDNLVYLIYTSGSTGRPKGTAVCARGFSNLLAWYISQFNITALDKIFLISSYSFDLTQKNIFAPLMVGGELHLTSSRYNPAEIAAYANRHAISLLNCAPSAFYPLLSHGIATSSLRQVFLGGEPISGALLRKALQYTPAIPAIYNTYGPTEATDIATFYLWHPSSSIDNIPIGKPIGNTKIYILNSTYDPVPVGVIGELYIAGVGVARGYFNRPGLTAENFMPDPFGDDGARMYKTGDLAKYLPTGDIEYKGRADHQVKVRGFRIELGEIETVLSHLHEVREAVVITQESAIGDVCLMAYCAIQNTGFATTEEYSSLIAYLRSALDSHLPEYMMPTHFIFLKELPLGPNGKVDRNALPFPTAFQNDGVVANQGIAEITETEKMIFSIWATALQREHFNTNDNFFNLGGHSLLAIETVSRMEHVFMKKIPLSIFLSSPTISKIAKFIDAQIQIIDVDSHRTRDQEHDFGMTDASLSSLLIPLHANDNAPPLFCIHTVGGQVFFYQDLARHLGRRFSVYGIQSPAAAGFPSSSQSIEATAHICISAIKIVQPQGPYHLIGWSGGGLICLAIASQLERRGDKVNYIGLLDVNLPRLANLARLLPPSEFFENDVAINTLCEFATLHAVSGGAPYCDPKEIHRLLQGRGLFEFLSENENGMNLLLPYLIGRHALNASVETISFLKSQIVNTYHDFTLLAKFTPEPIQAFQHFCWAQESRNRMEAHKYAKNEFRLTSHEVTEDIVKGDHFNMFQPSNVSQLAETIIKRTEIVI